ncbi:hypothetical protein CTEN210_04072 [Chaetoceros tenuissimus]|uniref:Uncharacterized protein n=1 Tax=Chaetoceros tenuissimus TaxID=426638 RepID=A0AAD3H1Y1_9STRA|nr:hypothetical protein CTEN210_04072 [Chaetoceros tenuissimus]
MSNKRLKLSHRDGSSGFEASTVSISDLPNDLLKHCFSFVPGSYITVAPVSKQFYRNYCTRGIDDSLTVLSTDILLKIGKNRRTTADAVSNDLQLTEYAFLNEAPEEFMNKVCHEAAEKNRVDILKCAHAFGIDIRDDSQYLFGPCEMGTIAEAGSLDVIKYLDDKLKHVRNHKRNNYDPWIEGAARNGHVHILEWLVEKDADCLNECNAARALIYNGRLADVIKRLKDKGALGTFSHDQHGSLAAETGSLEIFKYVIKDDPMFNEEIFAGAALSGNIEKLEYCYHNSCPFDENTCSKALDNTDKDHALEVLKWLRHHKCPWNEETCSSAVRNDNLRALKWARHKGCPWNEQTFSNAAKRGNIEMLEYCRDNGCPMNATTCEMAVQNEDHVRALETLKWLRKHSCPWDEKTCVKAVDARNFDAMMYARSNGCAWGPSAFAEILSRESVQLVEYCLQNQDHVSYQEARLSEDYSIEELLTDPEPQFFKVSELQVIEKLKLLRKYGYVWNEKLCAGAAQHSRLRVLQWLKYHGCPWDVETCTSAVKGINLKALKYAHENGCEWDKHTFAHCLEYGGLSSKVNEIPTEPLWGFSEIFEYLIENDCPRPRMSDWKIRNQYSP